MCLCVCMCMRKHGNAKTQQARNMNLACGFNIKVLDMYKFPYQIRQSEVCLFV